MKGVISFQSNFLLFFTICLLLQHESAAAGDVKQRRLTNDVRCMNRGLWSDELSSCLCTTPYHGESCQKSNLSSHEANQEDLDLVIKQLLSNDVIPATNLKDDDDDVDVISLLNDELSDRGDVMNAAGLERDSVTVGETVESTDDVRADTAVGSVNKVSSEEEEERRADGDGKKGEDINDVTPDVKFVSSTAEADGEEADWADYETTESSQEQQTTTSRPACENNGVWLSEFDLCYCHLPFHGPRCEKHMNPCYHSPCKNNGTCTRIRNHYNCSCDPHHTGSDCETEVDYCETEPCKNGGTCVRRLGGHRCRCPAGYTGANCEEVINYCLSSPCLHGAPCHVQADAYRCECAKGYDGTHCELAHCASSPCVHGDCISLSRGYNCSCKVGYHGDKCEQDYCEGNPCRARGICHRLAGGLRCECYSPHCGDRCEKDWKVKWCKSGWWGWGKKKRCGMIC